ncbi:MAG: 50S ribosomal protein L23 [Candidatus Sungbacteria bacterium]|nr:50S ribosomal protein L23 [bacterium]MDZ4285654.1 50S ribosomal protein L23 [Candidatus Sungbacteria bacterium]
MAFFKNVLSKKGEDQSVPNEAGAKTVAYTQTIKSGILLYPHITEKTSLQASHQKYVFVVAKAVNKTNIAHAVEKRFNVVVEAVHVINIPAKQRRRGKQIGWKPGIKKAIVRVAKGATIEIQ